MLTFNLKKEWFEKIKSGEKTHEYRKVNEYWGKRLLKRYRNDQLYNELTCCRGDLIKFVKGYTKEFLYARVYTIKIVDGSNTDLAIDKPVYDIEFELIGNKDEH